MNNSTHATRWAILAAFISSCSPDTPDGPPQIRLGVSECAECGMIVSDERCAAAATVDASGVREQLIYDDIGCLLDHARKETHPLRQYVHDHNTSAWIPAESAFYSLSPTTQTPMGSGIAAFSTQAHATNAAAGARALTFTEIQAARARWLEDRRARFTSPPAPPGG